MACNCCQNDKLAVGATPTHYFEVDADLSNVTDARISYLQNDEVIVRKNYSEGDVEITSEEVVEDEETITVYTLFTTLTEEETLLFSENSPVRIQIRCKFPDGTKMISEVIETTSGELLDKEEF